MEGGGKRPKIWGPEAVCEAAEGRAALLGGEVGVPVDVCSLPADFNLAVDDGMGRKW